MAMLIPLPPLGEIPAPVLDARPGSTLLNEPA
jgi:hypothetical protein